MTVETKASKGRKGESVFAELLDCQDHVLDKIAIQGKSRTH